MRLTLRELKGLIRRELRGSQPDESYNLELLDDPNFVEPSVYVADDVKKKIKSWARDMHLSTK